MSVSEDYLAYIASLEEFVVNFARVTSPEQWVSANNGVDYYEVTVRLPIGLKSYMEFVENSLKRELLTEEAKNSVDGGQIMHDILLSLIYEGVLNVAKARMAKIEKEVADIKRENPYAEN